jgi:hypothetical protein
VQRGEPAPDSVHASFPATAQTPVSHVPTHRVGL